MEKASTPRVEVALAEREKVREMCANAAGHHYNVNHKSGSPCSGYCSGIIAKAIRQLDLTAPNGWEKTQQGEHDKRIRAEVLAAVSKHRLDMDEGLCACGWESKGETWAEHILSLQPAASDLEALLREAERREQERIVVRLGKLVVGETLGGIETSIKGILRRDELNQERLAIKRRKIMELEKARAEEKVK